MVDLKQNHTPLTGENSAVSLIQSLRKITSIIKQPNLETNKRLVNIHDALKNIIKLDGLLIAKYLSGTDIATCVLHFQMEKTMLPDTIEFPAKRIADALATDNILYKKENNSYRLIAPMKTTDGRFGFLQAWRQKAPFDANEGGLLSVVASLMSLLPELRPDEISIYSELAEYEKDNQKLQHIIEFARSIAHELNQPLTGISGYCTLIQEVLEANNPIRADLAEIQKQSYRLEELVIKFQNIAHIEHKISANKIE